MDSIIANAWYVAMWSEALAAGHTSEREIAGQNVVVYRQPDGTVAALENRCPHQFAPLHMGHVCENGNLRCGYHGLQFDANGACVHNPHGRGSIAPTMKVRTFPIVERHSLIWVWPGDADADPASIPDLSVIDEADPNDVTFRDVLEMDVNYELLINNLLDLSHVAFLHGGVLGNDSTVSARLSVEQDDDDSVSITRWMPHVKPPGLFDMLYRRDGALVDHWATMRWIAPSCLVNDAGVTALGAPRSEGTGIYGLHLLTPVNERKSRYHFAAVRQNPVAFPEHMRVEIMDKLRDLRRLAFTTQDAPMIEAQQRVIDRTPSNVRPVLLETDAGIARVHRVLDRLRKVAH